MRTPAELKRQAATQIADEEGQSPRPARASEVHRLLRDLTVSQDELLLQNEQLQNAHAQVQQSRNRFHDLFTLAPVAFLEVGPYGQILDANHAAATLFDTSLDMLKGKPLSRPFGSKTHAALRHERVKALGRRAPSTLELPLVSPSGEEQWVLLTTAVLQAEPPVFLCSLVNISEQKRAQAQQRKLAEKLERINSLLHEQAVRDPLTSLLNRRGFEDRMQQELERARREGSLCCALLVDCDDFKRVNDGLGHSAGDAVLATVAERLQQGLRPSDVLARIGGDEFMALLPEAGVTKAVQIAERLRMSIATQPVTLAHGTLALTVSVAVAPIEPTTTSLEEVLGVCRSPLHESKLSGKNRVSIAGRAGRHPSPDGLRFADAIHTDGFFHAAAHPIVRVEDGQVFAVELLARGPEGPLHDPVDLFRTAIESSLLTAVDVRCLRGCLGALPKRSDDVWYHLNVYPSTLLDLRHERLLDVVRESTEGAGSRKLCLELSEQQMLGDLENLREVVMHLRDAGIRIAIDDVGFGRSSLESLILLEPEVVKIDRRHVSGAASAPHQRRALSRIVRAAEALGAEVVAEGVESADDLEVLRDLGVRYGQGFLWGRPEPCNEAWAETQA